MDLELRGKAGIVTGASRGIGRSIAMGLAEEGCNLTICARNDEALQEAAQAMRAKGVDVVALAVDITQEAGIKQIVDETMTAFQHIDVLVNNVGASNWKTFVEHPVVTAVINMEMGMQETSISSKSRPYLASW